MSDQRYINIGPLTIKDNYPFRTSKWFRKFTCFLSIPY